MVSEKWDVEYLFIKQRMAINSHLQPSSLTVPKIQLSLSDQGATCLHRAGVAGLGLTLKQLEKRYPNPTQRSGQLDWSLSPHSISLNWKGCDLDVLNWLLKESFQTDNQGLIDLTGLNTQVLSLDSRIAIHQGVMGTFLQHNQSYDSPGQAKLALEIDSKRITIGYKRLTTYAHQKFAKFLCDKQGQFLRQSIRIVGWLYPGAVRTHNALGEHTKFESTPENALALLFAPVACWYFMLVPETGSETVQYILVIPEIDDLAAYTECDRAIRSNSYDTFWVANLFDAGLKFLMLQAVNASAATSKGRRCQSILFGRTKWANQQLVRTRVETIEAAHETLLSYELSGRCFARAPTFNRGKFYITVSNTHGIIAENLARGSPWWFHLAENTANKNIFWDSRSDEGLLTMIEAAQWDDQAKKLFIKACHEALRKIYAKIYNRTPEGESAQIERQNTQIRSELGRCKNAATLRNFMSRFFAEAGQNSILQEHWEELLPITSGEIDWRITRDLALLALASYKKVTPQANNTSNISDSDNLHPGSVDSA